MKSLASDTVTEASPADREELVCSGVCAYMRVHASVCVHKSKFSPYPQEKSESCFAADEFHIQPAANKPCSGISLGFACPFTLEISCLRVGEVVWTK